MKIWLTADWHLGDDRFDLMGRPFGYVNDYVAHLQENHNAVVAPEDEVIIIGDVCSQKHPEWLPHVSHFNGRKILVRGNHDRIFTDKQLNPYFDKIIGDGGGFCIQVKDIPCYITHYPTEGRADMFNLVGHIHAAWKYQLNMLNVGVDVHHFRPIDLESIPFHLDAICKYYDEDVWVAYNHMNASWLLKRGKSGTYFRPEK